MSQGWMSLALCLNGVSSCSFVDSVRPKSMSLSAKTSGILLSFSMIFAFHSGGIGDSPNSSFRAEDLSDCERVAAMTCEKIWGAMTKSATTERG